MEKPLLVWIVSRDAQEVSWLEAALERTETNSQLLAFSGEAELLEYISFSDQIPNLILIDDCLPLLKPIELAQLLLLSPFLQVAMVVLTSAGSREAAEKPSNQLGIRGYLKKPAHPAEWPEFVLQLCQIARGSQPMSTHS